MFFHLVTVTVVFTFLCLFGWYFCLQVDSQSIFIQTLVGLDTFTVSENVCLAGALPM